jgi:hypothetical protein
MTIRHLKSDFEVFLLFCGLFDDTHPPVCTVGDVINPEFAVIWKEAVVS